jgi:hypothetical protein
MLSKLIFAPECTKNVLQLQFGYHGGGCCESGGSERQKLKILSVMRTGATD